MTRLILLCTMCLLAACTGLTGNTRTVTSADPHRTPAGFFDMHVCNWPDRPLFFKLVFSSVHYEQLQSIEAFTPDNTSVARFDLKHYKTVTKPGKPVKRVYITDVPVPANAQSGWYTARIQTKDGHQYTARDHLEIRRMDQALGPVSPADNSVLPTAPRELTWTPVNGAHHYLVFIHDRWDGDRLIYTSPEMLVPRLVLPPGLLKPGGDYIWRINTRDRKEDYEYGDFNHGSLTPFFSFSVEDSPVASYSSAPLP